MDEGWRCGAEKTGSLIDGYVFLGAQAEPDWIAIAKDRDVLRVLQYDGGERASGGRTSRLSSGSGIMRA